MSRRAMLVFWPATAAAVFLLGGTVASHKAVLAGGSRINLALLALSLGGLLGSLLAAGRIVVVVGRSIGSGGRPIAGSPAAGVVPRHRAAHRPRAVHHP